MNDERRSGTKRRTCDSNDWGAALCPQALSCPGFGIREDEGGARDESRKEEGRNVYIRTKEQETIIATIYTECLMCNMRRG